MELPFTEHFTTPVATRRRLLKNLGALVDSGLLVAPARLLAAPVAHPSKEAVPAHESIGTVKLLTGTTPPAGWSRCDVQLLPVAEHPALFAVLGATYGGDGHYTFALPNLGEPTADGAPIQLAIKTANGPATTTALAELRLVHQHRPRPRWA